MNQTPLLLITLTFATFYLSTKIRERARTPILNPVLITIAVIITILETTGLDYQQYNEAGKYIEFWLKPAVVALALPLYKHLQTIKQQFLPIFMSQLIGSMIGILSVTKIAEWMGASQEVILSLAPKSVTTPIAIEISNQLGGIPSLTAAVVVCVGILGSIIGLKILDLTALLTPTTLRLTPKTNTPNTNTPNTNTPNTNIPNTNIPNTNIPNTNIHQNKHTPLNTNPTLKSLKSLKTQNQKTKKRKRRINFTPQEQGISIGTASHALGTAQMFTISTPHGTYATLGLILNGILTSLLAPLLLN